jgi:PHD/YefM family antitoxin component YafN of YafNO toxin-antitoxin module
MTGLEALQAVQFVRKNGKRFAVLSAEDWEALIEWLETIEDAQISRQAYKKLRSAGGNRAKAGWMKWSTVRNKLA